MRFLFITGNYKPAISSGGPVNSVSNLAEELVRLGHSVTVMALNEDDGVPMTVPLRSVVAIEGVEVIYFPAGQRLTDRIRATLSRVRVWELAAFNWLKLHLAEYDFVHLQIGLLQPANWLAKQCHRLGVLLGYHQRGNLDPRRFGSLRWIKAVYIKIVEKPALSRAAVLFALSLREAAVYRALCPNGHIEHLPNGVNAKAWAQTVSISERLAFLLQKTEDKLLLTWMARWDNRKGPDFFLRVLAHLKNLGLPVEGIMAGPGDCEISARCEALAVELGLIDDCHFLQQPTEQEKVTLLQRTQFFLLPTQGEGFSVGLLEAMAAKCCVVTTPEANFPELAEAAAGIVASLDEERWSAVIAESIRVEDFIMKATTAKTLVENFYSWQVIAKKYLQIVENCRKDADIL